MEIEKLIIRDHGGTIFTITYHKKGNKTYYHRIDGPAYSEYFKNGNISYEGYWVNNKEHRRDGPAQIEYNEDGSTIWESWHINDILISKDEINKIKKELKFDEFMRKELK